PRVIVKNDENVRRTFARAGRRERRPVRRGIPRVELDDALKAHLGKQRVARRSALRRRALRDGCRHEARRGAGKRGGRAHRSRSQQNVPSADPWLLARRVLLHTLLLLLLRVRTRLITAHRHSPSLTRSVTE